MNSDALPLTLNENAHRYALDGKRVPSVTTILDGGLPKPALKRWGERVVATAAVDQLESLGQLLTAMGRQPTIDALAAAPYEQMKTAQVRGTTVHELAEHVVHGASVIVPDELSGHVRGYASFLESFDVDPIATEALIANRTHWYAGKFDLLADIKGRVWLLDLKTSRGVYSETAMQCAAYAKAELCIVNNEEVDFVRVDSIGVVHITEYGSALYDLGGIEPAFQEFLACLATYKGVQRRTKAINFDPLSPEDT